MRARTALVAAILVWTSIAALAAPAAAQFPAHPMESRLTLVATPLEAPVKPLEGVGVMKVMVSYTHMIAPTLSPTQIYLKVDDKPNWAVATLSPSTIQMRSHCFEGQTTCRGLGEAVLTVYTLADAPAFTVAEVKISAYALPNGLIAGSHNSEPVAIVADYFALTKVDVPESVEVPRGGVARDALTIANHGNGDTRVRFELLDAPDGVRVSLPNPIVLESKQRGGKTTEATLPFKVEASPTARGGVVTFLVNTTYALDDTLAGESLLVSFTVEPGEAADAGAAVVAAASFATAGPQAGSTLALGLVGAIAGLALAWRKMKLR